MNPEDAYAGYLEHGLADASGAAALDPGTREELDALRELLASEATWAEPPAGLVDEAIAEIREQRGPATPVIPAAPPIPHRRRGTRYLVAAAAAVVLVVAAAGLLATRNDNDSGQFALSATGLAPKASGSVRVTDEPSGLSIALTIDGLPPAPAGTFYQAWMKGPRGSVPIGTFHAHEAGGPIELWSGVDTHDYPMMTVTIQQTNAGPESSGRVVLSGDISGARSSRAGSG
jgi:hypothetical protein